MPQFRFTENTPRGPITVEANDDAEAISLILSRMKNMGDSRHVVSGTLSDQSGRIVGETTLLPLSGSAQYRPRNSTHWYTIRAPGNIPPRGFSSPDSW